MINEISSSNKYQPLIQQKFPDIESNKINNGTNSLVPDAAKTSFVDTLKGFIGEVNQQQETAKEASESFIKGDNIDLHDVMIAGAKAKTSFQLLMELRTKGLDLYREVIRMPV